MKTPRLLLLALLACVPLLHGAEPGKTQNLTSPNQVPEGLAKSDWQSIRAAYEAGRHAFQPVEGGWQARNPGQQWTTKFDGRGFLSGPRDGGWEWGLELQSYGFGERQRRIGTERKAAVQAAGTRLTYHWDAAVQEWFVNDGRGLEHGFTIKERPAVTLNDPPSTLNFLLATRGTLHPRVTADALGVLFQDTSGATVLNYTGLKVTDADGKVLASRFEAAGEKSVRLLVEERGARYPITIDPIAQQAYLKPDDAGSSLAGHQFGYAVAVSGDTVVVGAPFEDSSSLAPNESAADAGAAYVFVRNAGVWRQQGYLKPGAFGTTQAGDNFGVSVAVSGDTVVVGAFAEDSISTGVNSTPNELGSQAGAAYVFLRSGTFWNQQAYLKPATVGSTQAGDNFGRAVAIAGDTVVVGSNGEDSSSTGVNSTPNELATDAGAAFVYVRSGTIWTQQAYLKAAAGGSTRTGDEFGVSVSISGDTVVVGAHLEDSSTTGVNSTPNESAGNAGAAYVFTRSGTTWTQQAYLKPSAVGTTPAGDLFGFSVSVAGDTLAVGAVFEDSGTTGVNSAPDESATAAGAAYVFTRTAGVWTQQAYLKPAAIGTTQAGDGFGRAVAVSGDTLIVGAPLEDSGTKGVGIEFGENASDAGAAGVIERSAGVWTQQVFLKPAAGGTVRPADNFGTAVAVSGDTVVVGAPGEDSSTTGVDSATNADADDAGAAFIFVRNAGTWTQQAYLKPAAIGTTQAGDLFGRSVAISGDRVVIGAPGEDSGSSAVNESAFNAGAAYVFIRIAGVWSQEAYLKPSVVGTTQAGDNFGFSVAISGDTLVVGAPFEDSNTTGVNSTPNDAGGTFLDSGAAYVFEFVGSWVPRGYLKTFNAGTTQAGDNFGSSVAVSGDTVVVGAPFEDSSTTGVGTTPNEGAGEAGAAFVYVRSVGVVGVWSFQAYLKPAAVGTTQAGDEFGFSVSISGNTVVVGAQKEDSSTTGVNSTPNESSSESGAAYVFKRIAAVWSQEAYLKSSSPGTTQAGDFFGCSVSVADDTLVVGALREDSSSTGVNSTPDESAVSAGAACVFVRNLNVWTQQAYLKPAAAGNTQAGDAFGQSVAVSGDTVIAGAPGEDSRSTGIGSTPNESAADTGAATVFERSAGLWTPQAYVKPSAVARQAVDNFGFSVAVSGDTAVVGAPFEDSSTTDVNSMPNEASANAGAAYIFQRIAGAWTQQAYLKPASVGTTQAGDQFGISVSISGDTVIVGAPFEDSNTIGVGSTPNDTGGANFNSGAAYIFVRAAGVWTQQAYLKTFTVGTTHADDRFGESVSVSGDTVVIGASQEDSSSTGVNSTPNEGSPFSGAAYIYVRSAGVWAQQAYLKPAAVGTSQELDLFGSSVAISGDTVVVGAPSEDSSTTGVNSTPNDAGGISFNSGAANIFARSAGVWTQQAYLKPAAAGTTQERDTFGRSVAVSGDLVVVGAPEEDSSTTGVNTTPNESANDSGAAYLFVRSGAVWTQQAYLKPSAVGTTQADDRFGSSVAVSGGIVVVGAILEDSSTTGLNSTPNDQNFAFNAGAAYVFVPGPAGWMQAAYFKPSAVGASQDQDFFGAAVSVSGDTVMVGAPGENSSTTGVNSSPEERSTDSGAVNSFIVPRIAVEHPAGAGLTAGSTVIAYGDFPSGAASAAGTFTVRNRGLDPLILSSVSVLGGTPGDYTLNTSRMLTSIPFLGSTTFSVSFTPVALGNRNTTLRIANSDVTEGNFDITLTATVLSFTIDTDGDGLNDASEVQLVALGFDWQVSQPALVNTLFSNTTGLQPNLNAAGFFTPSQVQALHLDVPLIQRAPGTGLFTFTFGLQKSTTLTPGSFVPFPFTQAGTSINGAGKFEFQFASPDNAAFFRLEPP